MLSKIKIKKKKSLQRDVKNNEFQRESFYQVAGSNKCQVPPAKLKRKSHFPRFIVLVH